MKERYTFFLYIPLLLTIFFLMSSSYQEKIERGKKELFYFFQTKSDPVISVKPNTVSIPYQEMVQKNVNGFDKHTTKKVSPLKENAFSNVSIKGKSFIVYDILAEKVVAEKNGYQKMPLASLTKIMTAITAYSDFDKNKQLEIKKTRKENTLDFGLKRGQFFSTENLLKYMLVTSSNDAAHNIALGGDDEENFVSRMNFYARKFDLDMDFYDPSGITSSGFSGGDGSAFSVAKLVSFGLKEFPEIYTITTKKKVEIEYSTGTIRGVLNTNQQVENIKNILFSKTGFTNAAGGNLVIIVDIAEGRPVAIVVLGSSKEGRFSDMNILYTALQKSL